MLPFYLYHRTLKVGENLHKDLYIGQPRERKQACHLRT